MVNPLNLYATKVFAEQPIGLWALDDEVDYLSLVSAANQDLNTWTSTGVTSIVDATDENVFSVAPPSLPLANSPANGIIADANNNGLVTFTSPTNYQPADFSSYIETFSIGTYVYSYSKIIDLRLGYRYVNPSNSQTYEVIKAATTSTTLAWASVSESFELPASFQDLELIIEVYYESEGAPYEFVLNGFTAGQWAEEFQLTSLGVQSSTSLASENLPLGTTLGVPAQPYGLAGDSGYYLIHDNNLLAKNNTMPLLFGAKNSTSIIPNINGEPSLIIPGLGFMNESGKNSNLTAEFWIKIDSKATQFRRIFGPIGSDDGLYVDGPFLKLKVGDQVGSHPIREWSRPMLVDIRLDFKKADLLINGDEVITINRNANYSFPSSTSTNGQNQNWLGFYAYDDVPSLHIDCVGIYPYIVATAVAKRRWGYGQAVKFPVDVKGLDSSKTISIDYDFSEYHKNYKFPSSSGWLNSTSENLVAEEDSIAPPSYSLPTSNFNDKTHEEWLDALAQANDSLTDTFIAIRPDKFLASNNPIVQNNEWQNSNGYLLFDNLNFMEEPTKAFYGIFETTQNYSGRQTLFKIVNQINFNTIEIYIAPSEYSDEDTGEPETEMNIYYSFTYTNSNGTRTERIFYESRGQRPGDRFLVGLDIDRFVADQGQDLATFFGTRQNVKMYVGGSPTFSNTYLGKIRRIGLCNASNLNKIRHFFGERGVPVDYENVFDIFGPSIYDAGADYFGNDDSFWSLVLDGGSPYDFVTIKTEEHTASYTLMAKNDLNDFTLDIDTNSYWHSYVPLSYFSKEIVDAFGNKTRAVSFLQFNLDYPRLEIFDGTRYNTNASTIKSYISFQYLSSGSNKLFSSFTTKQALNNDRVVRPDDNWLNTLYEVVNGSVIYPPANINIDQLSINIHLEIINENSRQNPISLRSLQLASQSYGDSPNRIGTRFGNKIIPFSRSGNYFNYRNVAPLQITKQSSPYLYQTANTGIKMLTNYDNTDPNGLSMKINTNASPFFKIGSMQMAIRYEEDLLPEVPVKIFEIETPSDNIDFFLVADSKNRKRGQIYAIVSGTNRLQPGIVFFTNGKVVKRPVVYPNSWTMLGISFPEFLDVSNVFGSLRVLSPLRFNNLSFYKTTLSDDEERFGFRQWFSVRSNLGVDIEWGYWAGKELVGEDIIVIPGEGFTWQEVLFLSATLREEIDASIIYDIYTGTSRIIAENDNNISLQDYKYSILTGSRWRQNTVSAV